MISLLRFLFYNLFCIFYMYDFPGVKWIYAPTPPKKNSIETDQPSKQAKKKGKYLNIHSVMHKQHVKKMLRPEDFT